MSLAYVLGWCMLGVLACLSCVPSHARPGALVWATALVAGLGVGIAWDWAVQPFRVPITGGRIAWIHLVVMVIVGEEFVKWVLASLLLALPAGPRAACGALSALLVMSVGFGAGRCLLSAFDGRWDPFPVRAGYDVLAHLVFSGSWLPVLVRYRSRCASGSALWAVLTGGWGHAVVELADRQGAWALPAQVAVLAVLAWSALLGLERTCWDDDDA